MPYHLTGVPLNPFALKKGEHLERPKVLRQLAFEDVYPRAYMYTAAFFARAIVPIELVKLGDKQVVVLSKTDERTPPLSINFLAEFSSVVSVVADRLVIASRPLPHIRE